MCMFEDEHNKTIQEKCQGEMNATYFKDRVLRAIVNELNEPGTDSFVETQCHILSSNYLMKSRNEKTEEFYKQCGRSCTKLYVDGGTNDEQLCHKLLRLLCFFTFPSSRLASQPSHGLGWRWECIGAGKGQVRMHLLITLHLAPPNIIVLFSLFT